MKQTQKLKIVFLDLDGTLLNEDKKVGADDIKTLRKLGKLGIVRVFATGRTFFNSRQVLDDSVPFDFLIFSSGAGIYDWKNKKMLFESIIHKTKVVEISEKLVEMKMNFSVHFAIPENHKYHYFKSFNDNKSDFNYRNISNAEICYELTESSELYDATQFLVITTNMPDLETINNGFPNMKVIRASSPIDGKSIWIEIFNPNVSKAQGAAFLCNKLNISEENTLSIGNDYNDVELLKWTKISYVVNNAPDDVKCGYPICCSNKNNPLTNVLKKIM